MSAYIVAHDLGTSGDKATLFSVDGELIKSAVSSYETRFFNGNWAEQNPLDWWKAFCRATREITSDIDIHDIAVVTFSGQMMGCVCVDKQGRLLRDAIIWADQRSTAEMQFLKERIDDDVFYRITGHRPSPAYSLEKLMWLKTHEPDVYASTYRMLHAKDYMVYRLTGAFITDYSDASGTHAFDLNTLSWSETIITLAFVDEKKLPDLKPSTHIAGEVTAPAAEETGLARGTPVVCGAGDGISAAVGAGCVENGDAHCYVGSSAWVGLTTDESIYDDYMRTINWAHAIPGRISPCGPMQAAGGSFSWMQRELCVYESLVAERAGENPFSVINETIAESPPGANGLFFLPYLMGERSPRWNPNARGGFFGLNMGHRRSDVLRSVIEGVALNLRLIIDIFQEGTEISRMVVIGGGGQGLIERQILADAFGFEVQMPSYPEEATSMGAAVIGGVGVGVLKDFGEIQRFIHIDSVQKPDSRNVCVYQKMLPVVDECYRALEPVFESLRNLREESL
ncbi:MAG: xylulokinase [Spirochaetales bacterium]|nr:xylulokinase [Spirochaetales bacterium]